MRALRDSLTTRGTAFVSAGLVLLVCGIVLGNHDLTRIGVLLLALPLAAGMLGRRHGLRLGVHRLATPARVMIDEPAVVTLSVTNLEARRTPVLLAEERLDYALGDRPRFVLSSIAPGAERQVRYSARAHTRGLHRLGPLGVRVKDPFGLTLRVATTGPGAMLMVLPRIHPLPAGRHFSRGIGAEGSIPHKVALHGEDDQAIREYRDGDDLRRIHWPATARTGDLMVRQEDRPAKRRAVVLLDSRGEAHGASGRSPSLEWAVSMAASVTSLLIDLGYAVHLVTSDPALDPPVREDTELQPALDTLAGISQGPADGFSAVLHGGQGATAQGGLVVAVTTGLADDLAHTLAALRPAGSTGLALVLDARRFVGAAERTGADAGVTAATLTSAGWSSLVVEPGHSVPDAWGVLTGSGAMTGVR